MPLVDAPLGDLAAKGGKVRSHRFAAANTALPWLRGDTQMVQETEKMMRNKALRLFVGGVSGPDGTVVSLTDGAPHEITPVNDRIELHTVVRNLGVGHSFPGGTTDSNESWIEVTAVGPGATYSAGALDDTGHVTENTRIYNVVLVDSKGRRIDKRNGHEMVAPVYVAVIAPSASDLSRYSIPLSALGDLSTGTTLKVRLLWRKFNRTYSDFAYAANRPGFAGLAAPPELPITEIASATLSVKRDGDRLVLQAPGPGGVTPAELLQDYAIGFLRQGDLKLAKQVVDEVLAMEPGCVNCLRTRARIQVEEGQFTAARQTLTAAEKAAPGDPQNAWLWAQVLVQEGDLSAAEAAVDAVLAAFPQDRMALKLKARVAFLDGRFQDSLAALDQALVIDPEDTTAYYYAMLAYRALGNTEQEQKAEAAYRYHKADESAQQATLALRQTDGDANLAAQKIKVFTLK